MSKKLIKWQFKISLWLTLWLFFLPIALAEYKPPPGQKKAPQTARSGSGTTRGCQRDTIPPTVLASQQYIGKTTSVRPTFAWYISEEQSQKIEVIFYEYTNEKYQKIKSFLLESSPGIMTLSPFYEDNYSLKTGKTYFWQVVLFCEPNSPSSAVFDRAYFEVVEMPSPLLEKLENSTTSSEKIDLYAAAGLWYDALKEALKILPEGQLGDIGTQLLIELANTEKPEYFESLTPPEQREIERRINHLREIARLAH